MRPSAHLVELVDGRRTRKQGLASEPLGDDAAERPQVDRRAVPLAVPGPPPSAPAASHVAGAVVAAIRSGGSAVDLAALPDGPRADAG